MAVSGCSGIIATRLEIKLAEPNPLFVKWLQRWLQQAEAHNLKTQSKLREALLALRSYPLPLYSGRDCAVLRGFGPQLCKLIDDELNCMVGHDGPLLASSKETTTQINNDSYQLEVQQVVRSVKKAALKSRRIKPMKIKEDNKPIKITKKVQRELELAEERERQVTMSPGNFRIELLVDIQETSGKNKRVQDQTRSYLTSLNVSHEIRRLTVGDFLWLARDEAGNELVLPYIVERKRMDDLASSIRDGRFHEQKHRLLQCGIQNIIYLVEDYGSNEHVSLPLESLLQALTNAQIQTGCSIVRTENHYRSMVYLQGMTRMIVKLYKDKVLIGTPKDLLKPCRPAHEPVVGLLKFRALYEDSARSALLTVREVFVQQLLQLHSLSMERVLALVEQYPTPRALLDAYDACEDGKTEAGSILLAGIPCGQLQRPLGEKISQCIYDFYRTEFNK